MLFLMEGWYGVVFYFEIVGFDAGGGGVDAQGGTLVRAEFLGQKCLVLRRWL